MPQTTIPTKNNLDEARGAIVLSISDFTPKESMHLLTLGEVFLNLTATENEHILSIENPLKELSSVSFEGEDLNIAISWVNDLLWATVFLDASLPQVLGATEPIVQKEIFADKLSLFENKFFNGIYKRLSIYSQPLDDIELSAFSLEVFEESTEKLFEADFSKPTHYERAVVLEDTFAPTDGSPILVMDDKGLMERQFFFDEETGEYGRSVTETFTYKGQSCQRLSYENVELGYTPVIEIHTPEENYLHYEEDFFISDGQVFFILSNEAKEVYYGYDFTITYQISRSYNIEFNKDVPYDGFRVNLTNLKPTKDGEVYNSTENVRILREGNRFENEYLAREIELNPLVNPQVQGFMYIDTSDQYTQSFRIRTSSQYLNGDGMDSASVMIEAIDEEGNEVLSPYLSVAVMNDKGDIVSGFGEIEPVIGQQALKARNTSGRAYYQFNAPVLIGDVRVTHKVYIVAFDRRTGIGAQYPLFIQTVQPHQVIESPKKTQRHAALPFEYFSRLYEREIPKGHPIKIFDVNNNGQLDRQDFRVFKERIKTESFDDLTEQLLNWEEEYLN